jgi:hypothetical protein
VPPEYKMEYPPSRWAAKLPQPVEFPPSPLLLEIQAAGRQGDELLARFIVKDAEDQAHRIKVKRIVLTCLVVAAVGYRMLHPDWPLSLLPSWLH